MTLQSARTRKPRPISGSFCAMRRLAVALRSFPATAHHEQENAPRPIPRRAGILMRGAGSRLSGFVGPGSRSDRFSGRRCCPFIIESYEKETPWRCRRPARKRCFRFLMEQHDPVPITTCPRETGRAAGGFPMSCTAKRKLNPRTHTSKSWESASHISPRRLLSGLIHSLRESRGDRQGRTNRPDTPPVLGEAWRLGERGSRHRLAGKNA